MTAFHHVTVLKEPTVRHLLQAPVDGSFVDGTLGGGGHSEALLEAGAERVRGIDRDPAALAAARARLQPFGSRFDAVHGTYDQIETLTADLQPLAGIVLDIGVSSPQIDTASRGFSFQADGPVDMRMDPTQGQSAADLVNDLPEAELANLLFKLGEEPRSRRIARGIVAGRPWTSTLALAEAVSRSSGYRNSRVHPATRTFQALRIAVNDELGQLARGLEAALRCLAVGGRLAVITFHSLEDRLVKRTFRAWTAADSPRDAYGHPTGPVLGRSIVRKGISGATEDQDNPRARSARLRVFERTASALPSILPSPAS